MRLRFSVLLCAWALPAGAADLDGAIQQNRTAVLTIRAKPGAKVQVEQLRHEFWFGATVPTGMFTGRMNPEDAARYKEVFASHFNAGVIEAAFKWHDMERARGTVNYATVDAMLRWADAAGIPLRGHCIFWGVPNFVQPWLKELSDADLRRELQQRGRSIGARYRDRFAEYDLNNEMIHANYYEQRLGEGITKQMAQWVKDGDPNAKLFVNDYDITTGNRLDDYVKHIQKLLDMGVPVAGIGVQGHLHADSFDPEALRKSLDVLAQFRLPVRITEFNFPGQRSKYYRDPEARKSPLTAAEEQAKAAALREYYRICFAHPAVTGIMMWGFWEGANWIPQSSLYKRDWTPTPAAAAYEDLVLKQWWTRWSGTADSQGRAEVRAFFGRHRVTVDGRAFEVELRKAEGARTVTAQGAAGIFENHGDVGTVLHAGSVDYDPSSSAYRVTGSGENMWAATDAFHYAWKQVSGDVTLTADVALLGSGGNAHRKAALMVRQSLDADAAYADAALHGDGLTSLQARPAKGATTLEVRSKVSAPRRLRLEKRGEYFDLWVAAEGADFQFSGGSVRVPMKEPFYVGLAVCAHDKDAVERAEFTKVDLAVSPASSNGSTIP